MRQPASLLCGSVCWQRRRGANQHTELGQCYCLVSKGLLIPHPTSSHLTHFPYVIGALLVAAVMLVYILSPCGLHKQLKSGSFFCCPNSHWFLQPEVMGVYLPSAGTLGWVVWPRARIAHSLGIPPNIYLTHVNVVPSIPLPQPFCATLPLCLISLTPLFLPSG